MTDLDADVIVVGCGPVGVMGALRCVQRGLRVIAVDQSTEIYPLPRALGMDDEIQELFARAGLLDELRSHSTPLPGAEFVNAAGERVVGIELPEGAVGALGLPPVVTFDQPGVERFLRAAAIEAGVDMRLGLEAVAIDDIDDGVRVEFAADAEPASLTGRWLLGADGAKSTIRSLRGITLVDQGFDQTWLVVDTTLLDLDVPFPAFARQQCDPRRICTLVPGPGRHRRWEFQLAAGERREDVLEPAAIEEFLAPWARPDQLRIDRAAVYRFHATVAETFRDGPVFLAGDAAHQMPPFNGQGMCTGMRDVENLSWKLAQVVGGRAGDVLLDTYDAERRPHAAGQVAHSVDAGLLIQAIAHDGDAALDSGYGQRPFPKLEGALFDGDNDLVGGPLPAPAIPIAALDSGWNLLRCDARAEVPALFRALDATATTVPADAYPGLVQDGVAVVVRPDRYISAVTADLAETADRFAPWFDIATAKSDA